MNSNQIPFLPSRHPHQHQQAHHHYPHHYPHPNPHSHSHHPSNPSNPSNTSHPSNHQLIEKPPGEIFESNHHSNHHWLHPQDQSLAQVSNHPVSSNAPATDQNPIHPNKLNFAHSHHQSNYQTTSILSDLDKLSQLKIQIETGNHPIFKPKSSHQSQSINSKNSNQNQTKLISNHPHENIQSNSKHNPNLDHNHRYHYNHHYNHQSNHHRKSSSFTPSQPNHNLKNSHPSATSSINHQNSSHFNHQSQSELAHRHQPSIDQTYSTKTNQSNSKPEDDPHPRKPFRSFNSFSYPNKSLHSSSSHNYHSRPSSSLKQDPSEFKHSSRPHLHFDPKSSERGYNESVRDYRQKQTHKTSERSNHKDLERRTSENLAVQNHPSRSEQKIGYKPSRSDSHHKSEPSCESLKPVNSQQTASQKITKACDRAGESHQRVETNPSIQQVDHGRKSHSDGLSKLSHSSRYPSPNQTKRDSQRSHIHQSSNRPSSRSRRSSHSRDERDRSGTRHRKEELMSSDLDEDNCYHQAERKRYEAEMAKYYVELEAYQKKKAQRAAAHAERRKPVERQSGAEEYLRKSMEAAGSSSTSRRRFSVAGERSTLTSVKEPRSNDDEPGKSQAIKEANPEKETAEAAAVLLGLGSARPSNDVKFVPEKRKPAQIFDDLLTASTQLSDSSSDEVKHLSAMETCQASSSKNPSKQTAKPDLNSISFKKISKRPRLKDLGKDESQNSNQIKPSKHHQANSTADQTSQSNLNLSITNRKISNRFKPIDISDEEKGPPPQRKNFK
ncbi:hypothetical protein O181_021409 [Austropuccinia psidii MF-1]|uniref:Uncharacterized protein n=1 Tax=Austropuccinia psidii MF-1 TaxID=1389203 RepID=A0A9Q3CAS0_9BASI|nr:hypothetical protein [Austropuccinia psidii MF-1]